MQDNPTSRSATADRHLLASGDRRHRRTVVGRTQLGDRVLAQWSMRESAARLAVTSSTRDLLHLQISRIGFMTNSKLSANRASSPDLADAPETIDKQSQSWAC